MTQLPPKKRKGKLRKKRQNSCQRVTRPKAPATGNHLRMRTEKEKVASRGKE